METSVRWSTLPILCLLLLAGLTLLPQGATGAGPLSGIKVCIDPGHGGEADPGAINAEYGLVESEINLDVAFALKALLEADGAEVVMTRVEDIFMENRPRYTYCNAQEATILVSVHTNSVADPQYDGGLTLRMKTEDLPLAQAIHDVMVPALAENAPDPDNPFRDFGVDRFASGVLLKSDMPATIVEPLFMSNPYEAALLVQPINDTCADLGCRRGEIALAVYAGVRAYVDGGPQPTPSPTPPPTGVMRVSDIAMSYETRGPNAFITTGVTVVDGQDAPVHGAMAVLQTTYPDGAVTTDNGTVTFKAKSGLSGTYLAVVTAVTKDGWTYDAAASITSATLIIP